MTQRSTMVAVAMVLTVVVAVVGCRSKLTGNEGNLVFSFSTDDDPLDFNKPIAVGASLRLKVAEAGNNKRVTIQSATFDGEALEVVRIDDNKMTIKGLTDGNGLLKVEVKLGNGDVVVDSVNMLSRVPDVMKLSHTCGDGGVGHYIAGQRILVPYEFERDNGQPVIGFGYYPVSTDPTEAMTVDASVPAQTFMHIDLSETPQAVTMSNEIDANTLDFNLVEAGSIDGAILLPNLGALVGVPTILYALPTTGDKPICQAITDMEVTSDTPEICDVAHPESADDPGGPEGELGFVVVTGKEVGVCTFTVKYLEGADGQGSETQLSADIIRVERPEGN